MFSLLFLLLSDCDNCLRCEGGKCRQCEEGYAITKIYSRRLCVTECGGDEGKVWDPVLESYICDKRRSKFIGLKSRMFPVGYMNNVLIYFGT